MNDKIFTRIFAFALILPPTARYVPLSTEISGVGINPLRVSILLCFIVSLLSLQSRSKIRFSSSAVYILLLTIVLNISVLWSLYPENSVRSATDLYVFIVYFFSTVIYFNREKSLQIFSNFLLLPVGVMIAYSVLSIVYAPDSWLLIENVSRNRVARDLLAAFPIVYFTTYAYGRDPKYIRRLITFAMIILIIASGSRSGMIALVFALLAILIVRLVYINGVTVNYATIASLCMVFLFMIGIYIIVLVGILPDRLLKIPFLNPGSLPEILGEKRFEVRIAEINTILEYPVTGIGYGSFSEYAMEKYGITVYHPHSIVTRMWIGAGVTGVSLLIISGISVIKSYIYQIKQTDTRNTLLLYGGLIGLMSTTLTGMFNIVILQPLFYILIGIGVSDTIKDQSL